MADTNDAPAAAFPSLEEMQHWTWVMGRAQQMMLENISEQMNQAVAKTSAAPAASVSPWPGMSLFGDPADIAKAQVDMWTQGMAIWQRALGSPGEIAASAAEDKRFAAPQWRDPLFDMIRQSYLLISDRLLGGVEALEGVDEKTREKIRFATRAFVDAMAPSNFALTNPLVLERMMETKGENLLKGLENMLRDIGKGQLTHTDPDAFEVGRNVATTPGKVVKRTPLYELIQYSPTTDQVFATPLIIFPPWINRFYILDLNPKKSFIRWAVEQGLTVFVVSWKSADESLVDIGMDDYVLAEIEAIDTVRDLLNVEAVHAIGYCVAGTKLAAGLALLAARNEADKVASATFFTAQVDFSEAGDLGLFLGDEQMQLIQQLSAEKGYLDGRYMAATFNLLRGRDLIWNYVTNNYLMGDDYPQFDLLHWNGDTTNLPAKWHQTYLDQLYRRNLLVEPGAVTIDGTPIDLTRVKTPTYVQAGREDHIAPPQSVWKITHHFKGPLRFVLAGSGHIAGVVNPPEAQKYQYWINDAKVGSLDEFIAGARETKGSWWPDWIRWIENRSKKKVAASGARVAGKGRLKAIEDAPGSYVRSR
ncbi:MAG: class I poly(R)-hydroxyalkanoic acid synthase [Sphingosinicella sp.]|nr:class I poly(R)-hydroxyalkanoic acid synthase [Sphingosinicella sp.]